MGHFSVPVFQASRRVPSGVVAGQASRVPGSWSFDINCFHILQREALFLPLFAKLVLPLCLLCVSQAQFWAQVSCCDNMRLWDQVVHRVPGVTCRWRDSPWADDECQAESQT